MNFVLITPAKNEAKNIQFTIDSIVRQTVRPLQWVIVSDGSTDETDALVRAACEQHNFIVYRRNDSPPGKMFSSKVNAFNLGKSALTVSDYDFIGNIDADVSFDEDYFAEILAKFSADEDIGLAGGLVYEVVDGKATPFRYSPNSVSGAVQLFRRACFEEIGGYIPNKTGGIDSAAEICARAAGWKVQTFPEYRVMHHGQMLTGASSQSKMMFRSGETKYRLGYHPLFQIMSSIGRLSNKPFIVGSLNYLMGYFSAYVKKEKIILPEKVVRFLQNEQLERLRVPRILWNKNNR